MTDSKSQKKSEYLDDIIDEVSNKDENLDEKSNKDELENGLYQKDTSKSKM